MNLILFGFKGCGKTYFGKKVAQKMGCSFIDTDQLITEIFSEHGESPRVLYSKLGEEGFRNLEKKAIEFLKPLRNRVIALGGGTVLVREHVEQLQRIGKMIYLKAEISSLRNRILRDSLPAFLPSKEHIAELIAKRKPIYESIRAKTVNVDLLDEDSILTFLCKTFEQELKGM